jgi:hypothetical protein
MNGGALMDPQAAWNEMLDAIAENNLAEAELRAESLLDWINSGGFVPQATPRLLPDNWDRVICQHLCRRVLWTATATLD